MVQVHGKNTKVLYGGYDLSGDFVSIDRSASVDTVDISTFGHEDHEFLPGLMNGAISWNFIWNDAPNRFDDLMTQDFGTAGRPIMVMLRNVAMTRGYCAAEAILNNYSIGSSISDAVKGSGGAQSNGGMHGGVVMHPLGLETATPGTSPTLQKSFGSKTIVNASAANPSVVTTSTPHGFNHGDFVTITGQTGTTTLNNNTYEIAVLSPTTFSVPVAMAGIGTGGIAERVSPGGELFLQYMGVQGTTPSTTVSVMDSINGTTWASKVTAPAIVTAGTPGARKVLIPGPIREFVRLEWVITGSATPGATWAAMLVLNSPHA